MHQNDSTVGEPTIEYVNIYNDSVKRLSVFQGVTDSQERDMSDYQPWNGVQ